MSDPLTIEDIQPIWVYENGEIVIKFIDTRPPEKPKEMDDGVDREEGD